MHDFLVASEAVLVFIWQCMDVQSYFGLQGARGIVQCQLDSQSLPVCVPVRSGLEYGLHALPKEVLLKILAMAAVPLGSWMAGLPKINATEGMPEKPLSLEKLKEHQHSNIQ